ncbi:MAG: RHS repeat-associated core domain-containing protein, partial [Actinomycetota bacterium]
EYAYDQAGNLVRQVAGAPPRVFDAFNMLAHEQSAGVNRDLLYTVDDQRVAILDRLSGKETWTLRGLDQKVLRDVETSFGAWSWQKDYVYRGSGLLAAVVPPGGAGDVLHYHLDHLGSVRTVTDANGDWAVQAPGQGLRYLKHWPYGDLLDGFNRESERLRFTGHERDFNCPQAACEGAAAQADDLDYMHARHYSPWLGRFASIDAGPASTESPRSWNRYAYVEGDPLNRIDPDGNWGIGVNLGAWVANWLGIEGDVSVVVDHTLGLGLTAGVRPGVGMGAALPSVSGVVFTQEDVGDLPGVTLGVSGGFVAAGGSLDLTLPDGDDAVITGGPGVALGGLLGPQFTVGVKLFDVGDALQQLVQDIVLGIQGVVSYHVAGSQALAAQAATCEELATKSACVERGPYPDKNSK